MFFFRPRLIALAFVGISVVCCDFVNAQMQKMIYAPGELIEVEFMGQWHEAEVIELMPGGMMVKAKFTKRRGLPRDFMFPSMKVREIESPDVDNSKKDVPKNGKADDREEQNPFIEFDDSSPFAEEGDEEVNDGEGEVNPFNMEFKPRRTPARKRSRPNPKPSATEKPNRRVVDRSRSSNEPRSSQPASEKDFEFSSAEATPRPTTNPGTINAVKSVSRISLWRWVSFSIFTLVGVGLTAWGFLNRKMYW